jgi:hypothetical protein
MYGFLPLYLFSVTETGLTGTAEGNSDSEALTPTTSPSDSTAGVLYWQGFPGPAGYLDIPFFGQFPINVGASRSILRDTFGFAYLLRATVPDSSNLEVETYKTFYPAASFGRSTTPDDTPSNIYVPGTLLGSTINYGIKLFDGIEPEANASGGEGAIVLVDPSGILDYIVSLPWDGAKLDILQGEAKSKFNTFSVVGKLTTAGLFYDPRKKEIRLRDQSDRLSKAGLHDQIYGGTGGSDGVAELEGVYKPYGVGPNRNVEPILIDPPRQIRQLSCSRIQSVQIGRDGGAPITPTGIDYPSYAALAAAADATDIPEGMFSTCLAEGLVATGAVPVRQLTFDFQGDATVIEGTGYVDTLASIVRRIATGYGDIKFADSDLDFSSLNNLSQVQPDICGYWWKEHITKAEALKQIMDGRLGWTAVRLNGLLSFGIMEEPSASPAMIINYPADFAGEPQQLDSYQVPRKATYIGYQKNYTLQDASQLAGEAVDAGDALIYGQASLYAHSDSANPSWLWPTAQIVRRDGGFDALEPAFAEAFRQQSVMEVRRERWSIPVPCNAFSDVLGKVIQVNNYPRYSWGASRKFICVGISFASGVAVTLDLWG